MKALINALLITMVFFACKKTGLETSKINESDLQSIDPTTPKDAKPYIIANFDSGGIGTEVDLNAYELRWSDEFNSTTFATSKWTKTSSTTTRDPRFDKGISTWYFKPAQVSLDGSNLVLSARKTSNNSMDCGAIDSKNKHMPKYGFYEVRVDNANIAKAVHTAFWLQGINQGNVDGSGADGCEVDVFESAFTTGQHTQTALHWDGYNPATKGAWTRHWNRDGATTGSDIHTGYHIIGLRWNETNLTVYYDGTMVAYYSGVGVPTVNEYLILSVGASFGDGDFISQPIGNLTQAKFDWVRCYQLK